MAMSPTLAEDYITKNPVPEHWKHPLLLLVRKVQEVPKTIYIIALICLHKLKSKYFLLKIPYTSFTGLRGINLELTWKTPT